MSTIIKEFTKEQLQQIIETDHVQCGEASALARIALASLEAEPVAWAHRLINKRNGVVHPWVYGSAEACPSEGDIFNIEVMPLYTAPPAPVSVPAAMEIDDDFDSAFEHGKAVGWNAYRAAMLQAEPVSNSDELPLDYLQGRKDGLEWAAQLAEANHPQTGDWLYDDPIDLARAIRKGPDMPTVQGGNSPVTPDAWISCSERMPVIGELNWRTSFPLLITCEIGVIPAYYGFVSVNGNKHYGFMESLKYGDDNGNHPQTNEYGLISNVTHWMPLPEPPSRMVNDAAS
ncbi:TPA: DUF551 domain-containing protein [Escherichia coli]|nr:DUF551 domain-containing protein [Escherichia coli]